MQLAVVCRSLQPPGAARPARNPAPGRPGLAARRRLPWTVLRAEGKVRPRPAAEPRRRPGATAAASEHCPARQHYSCPTAAAPLLLLVYSRREALAMHLTLIRGQGVPPHPFTI